MKKKTKEFLLNQELKKWLKANKGMMDDMQEIFWLCQRYEMMWGIRLVIGFEKPEENKGRQLGVGVVEELFESPNNETHG